MPERDPIRSQGDLIIDVGAGGSTRAYTSETTGTPFNATPSGDWVVRTGDKERLRITSAGAVSGVGAFSLGWFNVKDPIYGAKGDGTTDDTAAIQAAITACQNAGGGIVYLPIGAYRTSAPLVVSADNVLILGAGRGTPKGAVVASDSNPVFGGSVIRPLASFTGSQVLKCAWGDGARALSGVVLQDFSIDGFFLPANVAGIYFSVFDGGMERVTVARATGDGFIVEGAGSTSYPQDAFDLRLHAIKADSCGGNGITFNALDSSDNVLSDSKFVACGGYGINNNSNGLQISGCHVYLQSAASAVKTVTRSTTITNLRLTDIDQHGIVLVNDAANSGNFVISGVSARDVGKSADNTYDLINYAPTATTRGGKITGVAHLASQANRPRYGVTLGSNAADVIIHPISQGRISPASSCFASGVVNDAGVNTTLTWRDRRAKAQGIVAQHFDRPSTDGTTAMTGGVAYAMLVDLAEGDTISNVYTGCSTAGSGTTLFKAGIYSADGATRYAVTADQSSLFGSAGIKTLPLTAAWQVPKTDSYYVVIVSTASTTLPALLKGIQGTILAANAIGSAAQPFGTHGTTGLTDLPATLSMTTSATVAFWVGVG